MDKRILLAHLEQAKRHAAAGKRLLAEQRARIAQLLNDGHDVAPAEALLARFEETQTLHLADVERLIEELAKE